MFDNILVGDDLPADEVVNIAQKHEESCEDINIYRSASELKIDYVVEAKRLREELKARRRESNRSV